MQRLPRSRYVPQATGAGGIDGSRSTLRIRVSGVGVSARAGQGVARFHNNDEEKNVSKFRKVFN